MPQALRAVRRSRPKEKEVWVEAVKTREKGASSMRVTGFTQWADLWT